MHKSFKGDFMQGTRHAPIQTSSQLSAHLNSLRKRRGLTQAQLGERIGVKQVRVADIERAPGSVSLEQLLQMLHALDAKLFLAEDVAFAPVAAVTPPKAGEPEPQW